MKMSKSFAARVAVATAGGALLAGVAGAAFAAPIDDDDVTVNVEVAPQEPVGALSLTVAADSTALTEGTAETDGTRVFDGVLPTVTVSDDRGAAPAENYWYVTGQSSVLAGPAGASIGADKLGWVPALVSGDPAQVAPGEEVVTSLDEPTIGTGATANNVGLVGEELLAIAANVEGELTPGVWSANAALKLKTPADQAPGAYSGTITLTLWEDAI
ncbi:hypothetical protein [Microbacterium sp. LWS13-1.2]|uniref:WxL domain-containing protein n=1 Tax=Microbacterium sp. LWS13-1.2 TaxID=3135264 RepID=A0AAU6SE10_9MICO